MPVGSSWTRKRPVRGARYLPKAGASRHAPYTLIQWNGFTPGRFYSDHASECDRNGDIMRELFSLFLVLFLLAAGAADAQSPHERRGVRLAEDQATMPVGQTMAYGKAPLQTLDFWAGRGAKVPLVIFVHGGGWKRGSKDNATGQFKAPHYTGLGYAFASINYRLVPDATVEQQAQDVADAIAFLRGKAPALHIDPDRIIVMGHSAGAHLAALVGTDMRYFGKAGLKPDAVRGIIPLDGAAYDVAAQMKEAGLFMAGTYEQAFGTDPARQKALSPTLHAAQPNAPAFLILHVDRADGTAQANALAAALKAAGTPVEVHALDGRGLRGHMQINRHMGDPDYSGTIIVDAWLGKLFG
jgi:arylformamidase